LHIDGKARIVGNYEETCKIDIIYIVICNKGYDVRGSKNIAIAL